MRFFCSRENSSVLLSYHININVKLCNIQTMLEIDSGSFEFGMMFRSLANDTLSLSLSKKVVTVFHYSQHNERKKLSCKINLQQ